MKKKIKKLLKEKSYIDLDIGCGENKMPGMVGMDYRDLEGVDIVWDATKFPWPLPDESVRVAVANHLIEHIPPFPVDSHITNLIDLLIKKKVISKKEIKEHVGEYHGYPIFMRFMDEVWRVLKPEGEFGMVFPYGSSPGFLQDPTHINPSNEVTWWYFDPLEPNSGGGLYNIYRPKPWKVKLNAFRKEGNMEVVLIKRRIDRSYGTEKEKEEDKS